MHFSAGPSEHSWNPTMTTDTTSSYYWLNWRVCLCAIWVLICMIIASILIWKYEGSSNNKRDEGVQDRQEALGILYDDESWRPCLKVVHPAWLLAFRLVSFFLLLGLLILYVVIDGGSIFYYYTQWTFLLVTVYFGDSGDRVERSRLDAERGTYIAPIIDRSENVHGTVKTSMFHEEQNARVVAGFWGYVFQIIYQTNAGAVMLTDCVFWFIIFPFLAIKDYNLSLILIAMHSMNAVFFLSDTALNSLRFPWFRISYFLLWTSTFVIFQWIVHACISIWWPYPFLDLSSPQAPIWYFMVALMHIPCYAIFPVILKIKHVLLLRWFPESYQP